MEPHEHLAAVVPVKRVPWTKVLTWLLKYGAAVVPVIIAAIDANPALSGNKIVKAIEDAITAWLAANTPPPTPAPAPGT